MHPFDACYRCGRPPGTFEGAHDEKDHQFEPHPLRPNLIPQDDARRYKAALEEIVSGVYATGIGARDVAKRVLDGAVPEQLIGAGWPVADKRSVPR